MDAATNAAIAPAQRPKDAPIRPYRITRENARALSARGNARRNQLKAEREQALRDYAALQQRICAALPPSEPAPVAARAASLREDIDALRRKMLLARSGAQADGYARAIARLVALEQAIIAPRKGASAGPAAPPSSAGTATDD